MASAADALDEGVKFDGSDEEKEAWRNAFYGAVLGSDQIDGGIGFGSYLVRTSKVVTGINVSSNSAAAPLPGPVISVEVTAGATPGPYPMKTIGPVAFESALVTPWVQGRDLIQFHPDDAVTEIAIRYLPMPQEMHAALTFDPDLPS